MPSRSALRTALFPLIVGVILACDLSSLSAPSVVVVTATPVPPTWTPFVIFVTATSPAQASQATPAKTVAPPAPSEAAPTGPRILRLGLSVFPDVIDPQKAMFASEIQALKLCYEGLTSLDAKGNVGPGGADRYSLSDDGLTLTFHIRDGLKRADGTLMNASDYEYALRRLVDPRIPGKEYANIVVDVKGATPLLNAEGKNLTEAQVAQLYADYGVKADDPARTLTITFARPTGFWPYVASTQVTFSPDKKKVDSSPEKWWDSAEGHNCNGPFQVKSMQSPKRIVYQANPNYWRGRPKLDRIEATYVADEKLRLDGYKKGQFDIVDVTPSTLDDVLADPTLSAEFARYPAANTTALLFNHARKPFDDKNVRAAFSQAVDREGWIRKMRQGIGAAYTRWIPPGVPGAQSARPGVPASDPKAALQTLVAHGYAAPDSTATSPKVDCARLGEIRVTYGETEQSTPRYQFLADNLSSVLNCPIQLDPVDPNRVAELNRDPRTVPQLQLGGWIADYAHPQNWLSVWFHCSGRMARFSYCNSTLDSLLFNADAIPELNAAVALYNQAEDLMLQDVPVAPLSYNENLFVIQSYLRGPRENLSSSDADWAGQWGPVWTYDVDLTQVPSTYPKE